MGMEAPSCERDEERIVETHKKRDCGTILPGPTPRFEVVQAAQAVFVRNTLFIQYDDAVLYHSDQRNWNKPPGPGPCR